MQKEISPAEVALASQVRVDLAEREMTQKDLAEKVGVTRETFNKYMKGKSPMPMPVFFSVAEAFGYSPKQFMQLVENRVATEDRWF